MEQKKMLQNSVSAYASICLSDLKELAKGRANMGKDGKLYLPIDIFLKTEEDRFGNSLAISIKQTEAEKLAKTRTFLGNGRYYVNEPQIASEAAVDADLDGLDSIEPAPAAEGATAGAAVTFDENGVPIVAADGDDLPF